MSIYSGSIVLYKNNPVIIRKVIESFFQDNPDSKLYLIDNSDTNVLSSMKNINPKIEYIFNNKNIGFGKAHNIALKKSIANGFSYHIILNPDIIFEKDVIKTLSTFMDRSKDVALVMPKVFYPNGDLQYTCRMLPTPFNLFLRRFFPQNFKIVNELNNNYELHHFNYDCVMNIPFLLGSFWMVRVKVLEEIGLFDENIFLYMEDLDLSRRLHKKYKTIFYPKVSITHIHARESYKDKKLLLEHIKSTIYYFNKWGWLFDKERKKINDALIKRLQS